MGAGSLSAWWCRSPTSPRPMTGRRSIRRRSRNSRRRCSNRCSSCSRSKTSIEHGIAPAVAAAVVLDEHLRHLRVAHRLAGRVRQQILLGHIGDVFGLRVLGVQVVVRLILARAPVRYPDRPLKLIVPFAPGGATDVVGRLWAEKMKPVLSTVVIENKASGGGALGTSEVARAQPDGYTLLFGNTSTQVLLPELMSRPPYDPLRDFASIYILCLAPTVIVVHESVPARTLLELIAYAKANPGKLSYGSAGAGAPCH